MRLAPNSCISWNLRRARSKPRDRCGSGMPSKSRKGWKATTSSPWSRTIAPISLGEPSCASTSNGRSRSTKQGGLAFARDLNVVDESRTADARRREHDEALGRRARFLQRERIPDRLAVEGDHRRPAPVLVTPQHFARYGPEVKTQNEDDSAMFGAGRSDDDRQSFPGAIPRIIPEANYVSIPSAVNLQNLRRRKKRAMRHLFV